MPCNTVISLFMHKNFDLTKLCPNTVKSHTTLSGEKGTEGCKERMEYFDGTYCESELTKIDKCCSKHVYTILKSTRPCHRGMSKITDTFKHRAITFSGHMLYCVVNSLNGLKIK